MILFAAALAVVLAALGWITLLAIERDRAEAQARRQAALEENVRLALWRMDSAIAPLVAAENARPPHAYTHAQRTSPPPTAQGPDTQDAFASQTDRLPHAAQAEAEELSLPPQPSARPPNALAEVDDRTSLQVSRLRLMCYFDLQNGIVRLSNEDANFVAQKQAQQIQPQNSPHTTHQPLRQAAMPTAEEFEFFKKLLAREENWAYLPRGGYLSSEEADKSFTPAAELDGSGEKAQRFDQTQRSAQEYMSRAKLLLQNTAQAAAAEAGGGDPTVLAGPLQPLWIDGRLILARRVKSPRGETIQGCWLDWWKIREDLLAQVRDLLPQAELVPARSMAAGVREAKAGLGPQEQSRLMATLPVRLIPGPLPERAVEGFSPLFASLALAWAAAVVAAIAVAVVLLGVLSLSERRAAFVGAVTHELRTPLTTFRMYAEMLAGGMVSDEFRRRSYLETLLREAERLSHLVENVLAYARLERGRHTACQPVRVETLLAQVVPRLQVRAAATGRTLHVEVQDVACSMAVSADICAAEQILFNLVDNACKYAADADDRRIHLEVTYEARCLHLRVRDHGPGFSRSSRRRLFKPFSKSAQDAARTAPGVGLGLALSRRLARGMRGDLFTEQQPGGACVVLRLPAASVPPCG